MIAQFRADYLAHAGDPAFEERLAELHNVDVFCQLFEAGSIESPFADPARFILHPKLGRLDYEPVNLLLPGSQLTLTIQSMDAATERRLRTRF